MSGVIAEADTSVLASPSGRFNKTSTVLWFNSHQGRWDAVLPRGETSDHWIAADVTDVGYRLLVDDRADTRCDVAWDDAGKKLWVLRGHGTTSRISRYTYDDATDSYTVDAAVDDVTVTDITTNNNDNAPVTVYRTPNGHLWVAVMQTGDLLVQRSVDDGESWLASAVSLDEPPIRGPAAMGHFTHGTDTFLLLFSAEDDGGSFHAYRIDQDATDIAAENWTDESASLPAFLTGEDGSDDHLSVRSYNDVVYVATKIENVVGDDEPIALFVRQPAGTWTRYEVVPTADAGGRPTRPALAIDATNEAVYVMYGHILSPREIRYKSAELGDLSDLETSDEVTLLDGSPRFEDGPLTGREPMSGVSDLAVVANDNDGSDLWWAVVSLAGSLPVVAGRFVLRDGESVETQTLVVRDGTLVPTA